MDFQNDQRPNGGLVGNDMREAEFEALLTWIAVDRKDSATMQNQADNAIMFLYNNLLKIAYRQL